MKWRLLIVAIGFLAVVGLVLAVLAVLRPHSGVTKANFDRINKGMTYAEVEGIFGTPTSPTSGSGPLERYRWTTQWNSDDGAVAIVQFVESRLVESSDEKRVTWKSWTESTETIYEKIRRWLHLK